MDRERLIYLAGLFDGEGCVTAYVRSDGRIGCRLFLGMVPLAGVQLFAATFALKVYHRKSQRAKCRPMCYVSCSGTKVVEIMQALSPHLVVKRKPALIAIALCRLMVNGPGHRTTEEEREQRLKYLILLRRCNERGIAVN